MKNRIRAWRGIAIALLLMSSARAQEPALRTEIEQRRAAVRHESQAALIASLREDLASDDPVRVAWAAYDSERLRLKELAGSIVAALERIPASDLGSIDDATPGTAYGACEFEAELVKDRGTSDVRILRRFVPAVLLDALLDLDGVAPESFLERLLLEPQTRLTEPPQPCSVFRCAFGPALAMFARHASAYPHLVDRTLDLVAKRDLSPDDLRAWIAAAHCVATDPKKLAEKWIGLPKWTVTIFVYGDRGPVSIGTCGGCLHSSELVWPDRLPPVSIHRFSGVPTTGATCLVERPIPLFWRREPLLETNSFRSSDSIDAEAIPVPTGDAFVVAMLRGAVELPPDPSPIESHPTFTAEWRDADTLLGFAQEKRSAIEAKWNAIVGEIFAHYRLDGPLPSRYPPRIKVVFIDERGEAQRKAEPLPAPW